MCDSTVMAISAIYAQFNYGQYLAGLLDKDFPVLIYNGDQDYLATWQGAI